MNISQIFTNLESISPLKLGKCMEEFSTILSHANYLENTSKGKISLEPKNFNLPTPILQDSLEDNSCLEDTVKNDGYEKYFSHQLKVHTKQLQKKNQEQMPMIQDPTKSEIILENVVNIDDDYEYTEKNTINHENFDMENVKNTVHLIEVQDILSKMIFKNENSQNHSITQFNNCFNDEEYKSAKFSNDNFSLEANIFTKDSGTKLLDIKDAICNYLEKKEPSTIVEKLAPQSLQNADNEVDDTQSLREKFSNCIVNATVEKLVPQNLQNFDIDIDDTKICPEKCSESPFNATMEIPREIKSCSSDIHNENANENSPDLVEKETPFIDREIPRITTFTNDDKCSSHFKKKKENEIPKDIFSSLSSTSTENPGNFLQFSNDATNVPSPISANFTIDSFPNEFASNENIEQNLADKSDSVDNDNIDMEDVSLEKIILTKDSEHIEKVFEKLETRLSELEEKITEQVKFKINFMTRNNCQKSTIVLKPKFLGKIKIEISLSENTMSAKFIVENNSSKNILEKNLNALDQTLRNESGITECNLSINDVNDEHKNQNSDDNNYDNKDQQKQNKKEEKKTWDFRFDFKKNNDENQQQGELQL